MFIVLLLAPVLAMAQSMKQRGASVEAVVPEGWEHTEALGDLNHDGLQDLVVVATPNFKENMLKREDGYVFNLNRPHLAIYFGEPGGQFSLFKKYETLIPERDEFISVDTSLAINDRGVLRIGVSTFASAGSADTGGPTYVFRFQDGDFYLIGKDESSMSRYSGKIVEESENYLTHRRQVKTSSALEGHEKEHSEKWTKLPRKPLQRLGSFEF